MSVVHNYGIIIDVENLDRLRAFYQNVIGLGHPVVDSNKWVEFQTEAGLVLVLRQHHAVEKFKESNVTWVYHTNDPEPLKKRLDEDGQKPLKIQSPLIGIQAEVYEDYEGNRFAVAVKPE